MSSYWQLTLSLCLNFRVKFIFVSVSDCRIVGNELVRSVCIAMKMFCRIN